MAAAPPPRRARQRAVGGVVVGAMAGLTLVAASCGGDDPEPTIAAYCDEVRANVDALTGAGVATGADVQPMIDRYTAIADVAPAAVEPEWRTVIDVLDAAAAVVPGDQASVDAATEVALAGQPSYTRIQQYTQVECEVALGTPPPPTNPVTATTVAPTTTGG